MDRINRLSPHMADLIAAGEVVERPASVVKELLENAVDAGATAVTVEVRSGGIELIRVTDNGCGMSETDARNCLLRHATSKIREEADLHAILTLGFRGEALAAISAVSKVEILTRMEGSDIATRVVAHAGEIVACEPAGGAQGTTISVSELFYNTPARMKFLKKNVTESGFAQSAAEHVALAHPEVSVRFVREGRQAFRTPGDGSLESTVYALFGREFSSGMVCIEPSAMGADQSLSGSALNVWGYITKPECAVANRTRQHFILNGRYIKSRTMSAALEEAFRGRITSGKFPGCVLHAMIDPAYVDVNVHPAKTEIRFVREQEAFRAVYTAVVCALDQTPRPAFRIAEEPAVRPVISAAPVRPQPPRAVVPQSPAAPARQQRLSDVGYVSGGGPRPTRPNTLHAPDALYNQLVDLSGIRPEQAEEAVKQYEHNLPETAKKPVGISPEMEPPAVPSAVEAPVPEEKPQPQPPSVPEPVSEPVPEAAPAPAPRPEPELPPYRIAGELYQTYIIVETPEEVLLIDKHAAHERMIYDMLCSQEGRPVSQMLLTPLVYTAPAEELVAIMEHRELLLKNGFDAEDFGGSVVVREIPQYIDVGQVQSLISEICTSARMTGGNRLRDEILHRIACKAAIKAGYDNSTRELDRIAREVLSREDLRNCPHGRPVATVMTREQLEKNFRRT